MPEMDSGIGLNPGSNANSNAGSNKDPRALVVIYADGACKGNPGAGGWGAYLKFGAHEKELCGGEPNTTNNRMELRAVLEALRALKKPCDVQIYTDSKYVQQGMNAWLANWKKNGWRTSDKKPVKNADLWQALDAEAKPHQIEWCWVKGHAGDVGNERADALANQGVLSGLQMPQPL